MAEEYRKFDASDYVRTEEDAQGLLSAAVAEDVGDGVVIRAALKHLRSNTKHERSGSRDRAKPGQPLRGAV